MRQGEVCGVCVDSPEHILTPLRLYLLQMWDAGGVTWIKDLGTCFLWLLESLQRCCLLVLLAWKVNSGRW